MKIICPLIPTCVKLMYQLIQYKYATINKIYETLYTFKTLNIGLHTVKIKICSRKKPVLLSIILQNSYVPILSCHLQCKIC